MSWYDLDVTSQTRYVIRHHDRVIGELRPAGDAWKARPTGSSVWTLWLSIADAADHCLTFVGWADREVA